MGLGLCLCPGVLAFVWCLELAEISFFPFLFFFPPSFLAFLSSLPLPSVLFSFLLLSPLLYSMTFLCPSSAQAVWTLETGASLSSVQLSGSMQSSGETHQEGLKCRPRVEGCSAGWEAPKVLLRSLTYPPKLRKRPPRCCPTGSLGLFCSGVALAAAHPLRGLSYALLLAAVTLASGSEQSLPSRRDPFLESCKYNFLVLLSRLPPWCSFLILELDGV